MESHAGMTDAQLDDLLACAFDAIAAPEEVVDSVRDALAQGNVFECERAQAADPAATFRRIKVRRPRGRFRMAAALAACLVLGAFGFSGYSAWADVVAVVGVDVNPSLELSLNRFDRVVEAQGVNEDGEAVLEQVSVVGMEYEEALSRIMAEGVVGAGFSDDDVVSITVVSLDGGDVSGYLATATDAAQGAGCSCTCESATPDEYARASAAGLTVGKYRVFCQLEDLGVEIDEEQVSHMSMRELRDLLASSGGDASDLPQGQHQGSGFGDGHGVERGDGMGGRHGSGHGTDSGSSGE